MSILPSASIFGVLASEVLLDFAMTEDLCSWLKVDRGSEKLLRWIVSIGEGYLISRFRVLTCDRFGRSFGCGRFKAQI